MQTFAASVLSLSLLLSACACSHPVPKKPVSIPSETPDASCQAAKARILDACSEAVSILAARACPDLEPNDFPTLSDFLEACTGQNSARK